MSVYSSQVEVGAIVRFAYPQPFAPKGDQLFKVESREEAMPTTRETVVACDEHGNPLPGAKRQEVTLEFVDTVH